MKKKRAVTALIIVAAAAAVSAAVVLVGPPGLPGTARGAVVQGGLIPGVRMPRPAPGQSAEQRTPGAANPSAGQAAAPAARPANGSASAAANPAARPAGQELPVEVTPARRGAIQSFIRLNGEVRPSRILDIQAGTTGRLADIATTIGMRVGKNDILAYIDPSRPGLRYEWSPVRAPIDGTVLDIHIEAGGSVTVNTPILKIGDLSALEIVVEVPERFTASVRPAMRAEATVIAFPGQTFQLRAITISPVINPQTRSKSVVFAPLGAARGLEPGMLAAVNLTTQASADTLVIPSDSLIRRSGREYVFIVENGLAVQKEIRTGIVSDRLVEVTAGLRPGEAVISRGQTMVRNESRVRVVSSAGGAQ